MITLHHCVSARSFRALWMLEELGLPYRLRMLPFPPRVLQREFLADNPLGTVPLLEDGAVRMTESAAICQYLATRAPEGHSEDGSKEGGEDGTPPHPLAVAPGEPAYAAWLNWLHQGEATLTFPQTLVLRYGRFESPERRQPQVVEDYSRWFLARLKAADAALASGQPWLCAGRFTAADVSVGYALMVAAHLGLLERMSPNLQAYWQRLQQRPAFARALAAQHQAALAQGVPTTPAPETGPPA